MRQYGAQLRSEPFHLYLKSLCNKHGVLPAYIIAKSGVERTFGHQIFNGTRKPSRDKVLLLAFGFEMKYMETQELLKAANKRPLHPRVKRDAVIIYALENNCVINDAQMTLDDLSLPLIGEDRNG